MAKVLRGPRGYEARPIEARFWEKVDARGICWEWTSVRNIDGYGHFKVKVDGVWKYQKAHRLAWEFLVGPIPDGLTVDHLCQVPCCVNPDHMELVPIKVNINRGNPSWKQKARRTECPKGHPFDESNTYLYRGRRYCRQCRADYQRDRAKGRDA